jgi:hypothetical protein
MWIHLHQQKKVVTARHAPVMMNVPVMSVKAAAAAPITEIHAIQVPIVAVIRVAVAMAGVRNKKVLQG